MGSASSKRYRNYKRSITKSTIINKNGQISSPILGNSGSKVKNIASEKHSSTSLTHENKTPKFAAFPLDKNVDAAFSEKSFDPKSFPSKTDCKDNGIIQDKTILTSKELYNILVAETWLRKPYLVENSYLLLLDGRTKEHYAVCHITTARHHSCLNTEYGCLIDAPEQLEGFSMIIIYGDTTGNVFSSFQHRNASSFKLKSEFSDFKATYPFLCTSSLYRTANERTKKLKTWPSEIIDGKIYQGNAAHASDKEIVEALGITHIINITLDQPNAFPETIHYMRIQLDDEVHVDLLSWLEKTNKFIHDALEGSSISDCGEGKSNRVLVHCNLGRSRSSTIVLGYLMKTNHWTLQNACELLKDCRPTIKPNVGFLNQLLIYEKQIFGIQMTDFLDLPV